MPNDLSLSSHATYTDLPLLQTKLMAPPRRARLVARPRLIESLERGRFLPLSLLVAPAGFGKTTAVSAWLAETEFQAVWLSLDTEDNDPIRFCLYLSAACERFGPGCAEATLALLRSPQTVPWQAIVASLINSLALLPAKDSDSRPYVLILDDYQFIQDQTIHDLLSRLIERLPPQVHIVITSRIDPPLPLARMRARGLVSELRALDLRCTESEGQLVLQSAAGLALSDQAIGALLARTEGWMAGLHLAALALQHHEDPEAFVHAFAGSHHYVLDYLIDEVFAQLAPETERFLLLTSILDRLHGPLCDALIGNERQQASQSILVQLARQNSFVIPLDLEQRWFRYHHLFGDVLRARLHEQYPELLPELHRRASGWYAQQGPAFLDAAVQHAIAGSDFESALELIRRNAEDLLFTGQFALLIRLLQALPNELLENDPFLNIVLARAYYGAAWPERVEPCLAIVRRGIDHANLTTAEKKQIELWCKALESQLLRIEGQYAAAIVLAQQVLDDLDQKQEHLRGFVTLCLALSYHMSGQLRQALQPYEQAIALFERHDRYETILTSCLFGRLLRNLGESQQAQRCYSRALRLAQQHVFGTTIQLPIAGWAMLGLGEIGYARGDLSEAARQIDAGVALIEQGSVRDAQPFGYVAQALLRQSEGQAEAAQRVCDRFKRFAHEEYTLPLVLSWAAALQAAIAFQQGQLAQAQVWAERYQPQTGNLFFSQVFELTTYLQILVASDQAELVLRLVAEQLVYAEQSEDYEQSFQLYQLQAAAYALLGKNDLAQSSLIAAKRFDPAGQFRQFEYAQALIETSSASLPEQPTPAVLQAINLDLAEPLTGRELEILHYIADGLSNQMIAERLVLSVGTVKTHLHHLYGKLEARDRSHAVARARQIGLL